MSNMTTTDNSMYFWRESNPDDGYTIIRSGNVGKITLANTDHSFEFSGNDGCVEWACLPPPSPLELEEYPDNPQGTCQACYTSSQ